ncbi:hypothetical protein ACOSP7_016045 [Xanthoceras sorbifolium]
MSTKNKKNMLKSICKANVGCGCGKPKLSDVYEPKPKLKNTNNISNSTKNNPNPCCSSSSSFEKSNNAEDNNTSTTISINNADTSTQCSESETDSKPASKTTLSLCPKIVDSVAVVKESNNPYQDFRRSMMQMIMEKEIYSKEDLQGLLNCFLELNSPVHHDVIVQAFTEIWNEAAISRRLELHPHKPTSAHGDQSHDES